MPFFVWKRGGGKSGGVGVRAGWEMIFLFAKGKFFCKYYYNIIIIYNQAINNNNNNYKRYIT